jgi:hypothetical protein
MARRSEEHRPLRRLPAVLLAALLLALAACTPQLRPEILEGEYWAEPVVAPQAQNEATPARRPLAESDYDLYILVQAVGIDPATADSFLRTVQDPPGSDEKRKTVGHAWARLEGPDVVLERGQVGVFGPMKPSYGRGVAGRLKDGHPNPVSYLWEDLPYGRDHGPSHRYRPTYAIRIPVTHEEFIRLRRYMEDYDFEHYCLLDHQCTTFAVRAAGMVGVHLAHELRMGIPRVMSFRGERCIMWTDERYSVITFGLPDVLEPAMRRAVEQGLAQDCTERFRR